MAVAFAARKAGSMESVQVLFQAHHDRVLRAAYRITGSMADAEDVAQVVFLRLLQNSDPANIEHAESYLYRAAINASLDVLRRRASERTCELEDGLFLVSQAPEASPERNCSSGELRAWLRQALAALGPRAAEMFVLRYLEDHDNREIARMLNTSQAVVAVVLYRARTRLRSQFRTYMRGER